jgi:hypothetical protein
MRRTPTPTAEARTRLQNLGEGPIAQFIGEISDLRRLVQHLPTVPGFRKMSKAGIERQKQELARRLASRSKGKSGPQDHDYNAFYIIWRAWVLENLGEPKAIDAAIDAIEEALGAAESAEKEKSVESGITGLFTALSRNSVDGKCSREEIERAFDFSSFSETPDLRAAIGAARALAEIERSAEFDALSKRLRNDEDEINSIKSQLQEITRKVDSLASAAEGWSVQRTDMLSAIDGVRASLQGRVEQLEARDDINGIPDPANTESKAVAIIKSLEARVDELFEKVLTLDAYASDTTTEWLASADSRMDKLEEQIGTRDHQEIAELTPQLKALEDRLDREIKIRLAGTIDPSILARLDEIEETLTARARPIELPDETKSLSHTNRNQGPLAVRVEAITHGKTTPVAIVSFGEAATPLALMFQEMGLKASAAKLLSEDICAALFIGQVVFFKGAYATEAARACAGILCCGSAYRVSLPLGLQYGEELRRSLEREIIVDDHLVAAIAIEGVNLAAFEILKDVLADLANRGLRNSSAEVGQAIVFGTISQGVASLPIDPSYLELGPIIDLDCLDWRSRRSTQVETMFVALSVATARSLRASLNSKSTDIEEAQRLARSFVSRRNPRVEHVVLSAYAALVACRKDKEMPTPLQSLVYGWLAPYWAAHGISKSDADSEVDGGKCDATTPDLRIKLLLDDFNPAPSPGRSP